MQFRNRASRQSYHRENKFHQYELTIHLHFGSVVQVLTNSAVLVSFHPPASLYFLQYQVSILEKRMPNSGGRSKTFPEVPVKFSESCGNPESRQGMVLGLGIVEG